MAAKKAKSKSKSGRGGKRAGSGRKPSPVTLADAELRKAFGDRLSSFTFDCLANLKRLADGGYERVSQRFEPAGLVMVDAAVLDKDGNPIMDARGNPVLRKQSAFPGLPSDQMVCVGRTVEVADADREANKYLIDQKFGRPRQAVEMSGPDGGSIPVAFEGAIDKFYGEKEGGE